jgi:hypothetical protein
MPECQPLLAFPQRPLGVDARGHVLHDDVHSTLAFVRHCGAGERQVAMRADTLTESRLDRGILLPGLPSPEMLTDVIVRPGVQDVEQRSAVQAIGPAGRQQAARRGVRERNPSVHDQQNAGRRGLHQAPIAVHGQV